MNNNTSANDRQNRIWVIQCVEKCVPDTSFTKMHINKYGSCRTWGFFVSRQNALKVLHSNATDICETVYEYAILEAYDEGISNAVIGTAQWFQFDEDKNGYFEIDPPKYEEGGFSYAMG